ncbi:nuclear transport factor 2 family protein [Sphingobacterium athyrii]|uniref:nuclear transport factor 2 family protein n=1 Tax=Sphingobacterium athyrii TaxID=2152717 RepID=UPI0028AD94EB|nr:nuclear transport factor 2 family protein [Sphingobacterium athyrii]
MEQAEKAIEAFVKAGDNRDVAALQSILHQGFQNIQDGFFDQKGIFVFSKSDYIELIRTKRFVGSPRSLIIHSIKQSDHMAIAHTTLESEYLIFHSLIISVRDNGHWKIINNTPTIEVK